VNSIENVIKAYVEAEAIANGEPMVGDPRSLPGRLMAQRSARDSMESLRRVYEGELTPRVFSVFLQGPAASQKAFGPLAVAAGDVIVTDGQALYRRLSERIMVSMGAARQFSADQLGLLILNLRDVCADLGISSLPAPRLETVTTIRDDEHLLTVIRDIIRAQVDDDLQRLYLRQDIVSQALAQRRTDDTLVAIVTGLDDAEIEGLRKSFFTPDLSMAARLGDGPVDEQVVFAVFEAIKQQVVSR
jgi:hypothetical protein